MTGILDLVKKYGPWLVFALGFVFNLNAMVTHWFPIDSPVVAQIDMVLGFLGLGSFRLSLAQLFAGIDLGPVGTWLTGKKTLIVALIGAVFNVALAANWITVDMPWIVFSNAVLAALGLGSYLSAKMTYKAEALKRVPEATKLFNK